MLFTVNGILNLKILGASKMSKKLHWICHHSKEIYVNGCREYGFCLPLLQH